MMTDRRGATLILTLITVAAFSLTAAIVYAGVRSQVNSVVYAKRSAQAQAIAEAGLEDALSNLLKDPTWRAGFTDKAFAGGTYTVTLSTDIAPWIVSTGYSAPIFMKGPAVRTVTSQASFVAGVCPYAIMADRSVTIEGRVDAYDPIASLTPSATSFVTGAAVRSNTSIDTGSAVCPPANIRGNVRAVTGVPDASCVEGTVTLSTETLVLPVFSCGACATVNDNLTRISPAGNPPYNSASKQLNVATGQTVTLSSGTFYFSKITLRGTLNVDTSSGAVNIYLNGNLDANPGCQVNNTSKIPSRLHFYDISTGLGHTVNMQCDTPFHAYVEGNDANFILKQEMYGHFCSNQVTISSAAGAVGMLHYDLGGGVISHVDWTRATASSWSESYKRQ